MGIILGVVGLKRAKQNGEGGRGLAIAAIVIGALSLAAWGLFWGGFITAAVEDHDRTSHQGYEQSAVTITVAPQAVSSFSPV